MAINWYPGDPCNGLSPALRRVVTWARSNAKASVLGIFAKWIWLQDEWLLKEWLSWYYQDPSPKINAFRSIYLSHSFYIARTKVVTGVPIEKMYCFLLFAFICMYIYIIETLSIDRFGVNYIPESSQPMKNSDSSKLESLELYYILKALNWKEIYDKHL